MNNSSRKAQRDSFAQHRAALLFTNHLNRKSTGQDWSASIHEGTETSSPDHLHSLKERVRAGLHGFTPAH